MKKPWYENTRLLITLMILCAVSLLVFLLVVNANKTPEPHKQMVQRVWAEYQHDKMLKEHEYQMAHPPKEIDPYSIKRMKEVMLTCTYFLDQSTGIYYAVTYSSIYDQVQMTSASVRISISSKDLSTLYFRF